MALRGSDVPVIARYTIALALVLACTGCVSFANYGRARVLDAGRTEAWVAPQALLVTSGSGVATRPIVDLGVRHGLTRDVELDAHASTFGVSLGPRFQLARAAAPRAGLDLALAPSIGFVAPNKLTFDVALPIGWSFARGRDLVLAPRAMAIGELGVAGFSRPVGFLLAGGSAGFLFDVTDRFAVMPEVDVLRQVLAEQGFASNVASGVGLQGGIGMLYAIP